MARYQLSGRSSIYSTSVDRKKCDNELLNLSFIKEYFPHLSILQRSKKIILDQCKVWLGRIDKLYFKTFSYVEKLAVCDLALSWKKTTLFRLPRTRFLSERIFYGHGTAFNCEFSVSLPFKKFNNTYSIIFLLWSLAFGGRLWGFTLVSPLTFTLNIFICYCS